MRKFSYQPLAIFATPNVNAKNFASATSRAKPLRNINGHLCKLLTARRKTKSHLKSLFKDLQLTISHNHPLLRKTHNCLAKQIPCHSTPRDHQEEEDTSVSRPYQLWRAPEGAIQTRPHLARLGQAPPLFRIHFRPLRPRPCHLLRVGVPSSPPQRRYSTQRPPTSPPQSH